MLSVLLLLICRPKSNLTSKQAKSHKIQKMNDIKELSRIGLISKVCAELDNHLGFSEKTLAEFIVHLASTTSDQTAFRKQLLDNGADFPESFTTNLYRIITQLIPKPSTTTNNNIASASAPFVPRDEKDIQFPSLSRPNSGPVKVDDLPDAIEPWIKKLKDEAPVEAYEDHSKKRGRSPSPPDRARGRDRGDVRGQSGSYPPASSNKSDKRRDTEPQLYSIYDGKVSNILDFGCFVELDGFSGRKEGLVHIAQIQQGMVKDIKQIIKRGQKVKVKVISISGTKLSLSMKDVDQSTGVDLLPQRNVTTTSHTTSAPSTGGRLDTSDYSNPIRPPTQSNLNLGIDIKRLREKDMEDENNGHRRKKLSSPELWEVKQLIQSGVLPVSEYPTFDAGSGFGVLQSHDVEEDIEVELNESEPAFLKGQTRLSRELSPPRIVLNPDGSLQRAALHQSQLAKERRELKQSQTNNLIDSIPKDLSKPWEDPMPEKGERHFAQELRSINVGGAFELPEWKAKTQGKTLAYGQMSSKPLKEQRESLPIYRLKSQLCTAIAQNQVLVVIGETGSGTYNCYILTLLPLPLLLHIYIHYILYNLLYM